MESQTISARVHGGVWRPRHLTVQTRPLHFGVLGVPAQSTSSLHWTQRVSAQIDVAGVDAQSVLVTHCTHAPPPTSHFGVAPEHWESSVQAAA